MRELKLDYYKDSRESRMTDTEILKLFLRDWKDSTGACIELGYAIAQNMTVIFQE